MRTAAVKPATYEAVVAPFCSGKYSLISLGWSWATQPPDTSLFIYSTSFLIGPHLIFALVREPLMRVSAEFTDDRNGGNEKRKKKKKGIYTGLLSQAYHFKPIEWVAIDRQWTIRARIDVVHVWEDVGFVMRIACRCICTHTTPVHICVPGCHKLLGTKPGGEKGVQQYALDCFSSVVWPISFCLEDDIAVLTRSNAMGIFKKGFFI